MDTYYLYKIINKIDGKFYIGMTKDVERRWVVHCSPSSKCPKLKNAIQKYGKDNFDKQILCIGSKEYIANLEQKYIALTDNTNFGYNIDLGGKYYRDNHKLKSSKTSEHIYVSGWWFPNKEAALDKLGMKEGTFYSYMRKGTLGELQHFKGGRGKNRKPVYVKGFWFPSVTLAAQAFGMSLPNVTRLSKKPDGGLIDSRLGSQKGVKSPSRIEVYVDHKLYPSIRTAAEETGLFRSTIKRRIDNNVEGYYYSNKEDFKQ